MSTPALYQALTQILGMSDRTKYLAQGALTTLQAGSVSADWVFEFLNSCDNAIRNFNRFKTVTGLDAYAQEQLPGYVGTMTNDLTAVVNAIQSCVDWVVTNFPKDSTDTYLLAYSSLAADGTKTPRMFTSAQTAGLQTQLSAVIALIG
jgi:hypothetical protein